MRNKTSDEYYTTTDLLKIEAVQNHLKKNIDKNFIDTNCGTGNWLVEILKLKLDAGIDHETALKQLYGVELFEDSVKICKDRLIMGNQKLTNIVDKRIICADATKCNYRFDGTDPYKSEQDLHNETLFEIS